MIRRFDRFEVKYALDAATAEAIRRALRVRCALDRTGVCDEDGWHKVDSLYLDAPNLQLFRDGRDGGAEHCKLRVRTYPDTPGSIVRVEVKWRVSDLVTKLSAPVPCDAWQACLQTGADLHSFRKHIRESLNTFLTLQKELDAAPKILIRYRRQAFCSMFENYVRVTFDSRLEYRRTETLDLRPEEDRWFAVDGPGPLTPAGSLLMELKFQQRPPVWITDLIRRFGLVSRGFSKYRAGIECAHSSAARWWDVTPGLAYARRGEILSWTF